MAKKSRKAECSISSCDREAAVSGLCSPCYSRMYYWMKKTPGQVLKRQKQLNVIEEGLELLGGNRR